MIAAQGRKLPCPNEDYGDGAEASHQHGGHPTHPLRRDSGFELSHLVRCADEDSIDGAYAPAHAVGRAELDQGVTEHYAHHVASAHEEERDQRQDGIPREAEDDGENAEAEDAPEHGGSGS